MNPGPPLTYVHAYACMQTLNPHSQCDVGGVVSTGDLNLDMPSFAGINTTRKYYFLGIRFTVLKIGKPIHSKYRVHMIRSLLANSICDN
jgi:hypothetical protein